MIKQICLHIPVADLPRSVAFFNALGFVQNPQVTGDSSAMIVLGGKVSVLLSTHSKFREFTPKAVCDTSRAVEALFCLTCESRAEVDALVAQALAAGGSTYDKAEDFGLMYTHSFVDLDGHGWGLIHISTPTPVG